MISCNRNTSFSLLDVSGSEGQRKKKSVKMQGPKEMLMLFFPSETLCLYVFWSWCRAKALPCGTTNWTCAVFQTCQASGMFYFRWSWSVKPSHQQTWRLIYKLGFRSGYDITTSLKSPDSLSLLICSLTICKGKRDFLWSFRSTSSSLSA